MKKAKIAELKNNLSRYLAYVRTGGSVLVLDRDTPIAEIVPLKRSTANGKRQTRQRDEERIAELERRGLIRRGKARDPSWWRGIKPVRIKGASVLQALLEERESGW